MIVIRGDQLDRIKADAYKVFFENYDKLPTVYDKIFKVDTNTSAYVQDNVLTGLGNLSQKPEGNDIVFERPGGGRIVIGKNQSFAAGIEFTKESVEDYGVEGVANILKEYAANWGEAYNRTKESFAADFFNKGGYTAGHAIFNNSIPGKIVDPSGDLVYDSKPFFNLSNNLRSSLAGGTYYNGHALALSDTNLKTVYTNMTSTDAFDENDKRISLMPDTLLVPSALKFTSDNILQATNVLGTANNDVNTVQNIANQIVWPYLTNTDAWFLGKAGMGLRWSDRQQLVINFYQDPRNQNYYATADARWGAWVNNWRGWQGSQFSTS